MVRLRGLAASASCEEVCLLRHWHPCVFLLLVWLHARCCRRSAAGFCLGLSLAVELLAVLPGSACYLVLLQQACCRCMQVGLLKASELAANDSLHHEPNCVQGHVSWIRREVSCPDFSSGLLGLA